ncbi:MAG: hypothetical protein ACFFD5_00665 [Candidatus Thorarchaeota archaeon]
MVEDTEKIEIIDKTEKNSRLTPLLNIFCSIFVIILAGMGFILFLIYPYSLMGFFISLFTISIMMMYLFYQSKSKGIIRKFTLTPLDIEFLMPNKPYFHIKWSEFDKIEIILKKLEIKPFEVYELHFIKNDSKRIFKFSILDFNKANSSQILYLLKTYAKINNKEFKAQKERLISGIVLVEDLII